MNTSELSSNESAANYKSKLGTEVTRHENVAASFETKLQSQQNSVGGLMRDDNTPIIKHTLPDVSNATVLPVNVALNKIHDHESTNIQTQSIVHIGTGEQEQNQITDQQQSKPHVSSSTNTAITMTQQRNQTRRQR